MTTFRFIHTSDLHLGKSFAGYPVGPRLTEARHQSITALVTAARDFGALDILLAGDTFDAALPSPTTWRQAVTAMAGAVDLNWWILPGNHDNLREAQATWDAIDALGHSNIHILTTAQPRSLRHDVTLLPAPLAVRRPSEDPTGGLPAVTTPEGTLRIGLAHGPVMDFGDHQNSGVIAPDRDKTANLNYLALGDWHGQMRISDRTWYSGTPEHDQFKHSAPGACLGVEIGARDGVPSVSSIETGMFHWHDIGVTLGVGDDASVAITRTIPADNQRETLLRIRAKGWVSPDAMTRLQRLKDEVGPDFCYFDLQTGDLGIEIGSTDLDAIASSGALRRAASLLATNAADLTLSERERRISALALSRLHSLVTADAS